MILDLPMVWRFAERYKRLHGFWCGEVLDG